MAVVILVVEDDLALRATLASALTTAESAPVLAAGEGAVAELRRGLVPDAIVVDLDMPDGFLVLVQLELETNDSVPIVAVSAEPRRLLGAGRADAVAMKPVEVGELRASIHRACGEARGAL